MEATDAGKEGRQPMVPGAFTLVRAPTSGRAKRGVHTPHGPWRISRSLALGATLPTRFFVELGLPLLHT